MPFFGCELVVRCLEPVLAFCLEPVLAFCLEPVLAFCLEPVLAFCLEPVAFGLVPAALRFEALPAF